MLWGCGFLWSGIPVGRGDEQGEMSPTPQKKTQPPAMSSSKPNPSLEFTPASLLVLGGCRSPRKERAANAHGHVPRGLPGSGLVAELPKPGLGAAAPVWPHPKQPPREGRKQPHPRAPNPPPGRASCALGVLTRPGAIGTSLSFSSPNLVHFVF